MSELFTRRDVIRGGGMIAIGLVAPKWLATIAHADVLRAAQGGKPASDTILIVCQFTGGNDGLNTVIPYADKAYYQLRPTIGISDAKSLKLDEKLALHPALAGLHELYKQKKVAVLTNVGYPQPILSHFKSMDIWQSASPSGQFSDGWLGRHFDQQMSIGPVNPVVGLGLSTEKPLALNGHVASIPCFASLADIKTMIGDSESEVLLRQIQGTDATAGSATRLIQDANKTAMEAMSILNKQLGNYAPKGKYGEDSFGKGFKQIAQLIATSPGTRVVYFSAGGFDTHAKQAETHESLLKGFGNAIQAFQGEMEAIGKADKVVVLCFSEFGRRVAENNSGGTDHGTAAPMFLIGSKVKGGVHGAPIDLSNLDKGNLKFTQDFRGVYATALDNWLGGDSEVVLGEKFAHVDVF